jgi:hypothetical protein
LEDETGRSHCGGFDCLADIARMHESSCRNVHYATLGPSSLRACEGMMQLPITDVMMSSNGHGFSFRKHNPRPLIGPWESPRNKTESFS